VSTPVVQAPSVAPAQPAPLPGSDSDTFLQDLANRVSSAEALLALPPSEQPGLLAFLRPSELAKVLKTTSDPELKLAVIETLESVGSPSALDIIYQSLDDPDPRIQTKALEAADRLLGAD
jgi:HEAT repeat protein